MKVLILKLLYDSLSVISSVHNIYIASLQKFLWISLADLLRTLLTLFKNDNLSIVPRALFCILFLYYSFVGKFKTAYLPALIIYSVRR